MYSSFARKIFEAQTSQDVSTEINALKEKLRKRKPAIDEFKVAFKQLCFTNNRSKQKHLVRYILRKFSEHYSYRYSSDYDDLTIEHIQPQSSIGNDNWTEETVGMLGNLIFIEEKINGMLGEKSYTDKIAQLKSEGCSIPSFLETQESWTAESISEHTDSMAEIAYNTIWDI